MTLISTNFWHSSLLRSLKNLRMRLIQTYVSSASLAVCSSFGMLGISVSPSLSLLISPSVRLSIYSTLCLLVSPSTRLSLSLSPSFLELSSPSLFVSPSPRFSICQYLCLIISPSVHLSAYLSHMHLYANLLGDIQFTKNSAEVECRQACFPSSMV